MNKKGVLNPNRVKLAALALGTFAIVLPIAMSCGAKKMDLAVANVNYRYSNGFNSYNPLSVSRSDQATLQAGINDTLFYTDRFNNIQGGLAKDLQDGGLKVSTTLNGDDFQDYDIANPQTGIKRWKVYLRDGNGGEDSDNKIKPVFVDYSGKYIEDLKPKHFVNSIVFYLSGYTGTSIPKMFNDEEDQGGTFILPTYFGEDFSTYASGEEDEYENLVELPNLNATRQDVTAKIKYKAKSDEDSSPVLDSKFTKITTPLPTDLATLEESIQLATTEANKYIVANDDENSVTYITDAPWAMDLFRSVVVAPIPDCAIAPNDLKNMGVYDAGFDWSYDIPSRAAVEAQIGHSVVLGEEYEIEASAIPIPLSQSLYGIGMLKPGSETNNDFTYDAQKHAYYTGHYLPQKNGRKNGEKIVFKARTDSNLHVPNYNSIKTYNYKIIDSSSRKAESSRKDYEYNNIYSFAIDGKDSQGVKKYLGNFNDNGNVVLENTLLPKSDIVSFNEATEYSDSYWNLIPLTETDTYFGNSSVSGSTYLSRSGQSLYFDRSINKFVSKSQEYLYDTVAPNNNAFLSDIRGRAYFAYNFNRSLFSTYWVSTANERPNYIDATDPLTTQVPSYANNNKYSPVGAFNNSGGEYVNDYLETKIKAKVADGTLVEGNLPNGSEIDQYYHNYNVGIKIFNTSNANKTAFEGAYSGDHKVLLNPAAAFAAIASEISSLLPSDDEDITLYLPIAFAENQVSADYRNSISKLVDNFNRVPNTRIHLVAQYCDLNPGSDGGNKGYNSYATFQPLTYGGVDYLGALGFTNGKYADFQQIGWGLDYNDPLNLWTDAMEYYTDNGFFTDIWYDGYRDDIAAANIADDRYSAFAAIEADVLTKFWIIPYYSNVAPSYVVTKYTPFTRGSINDNSIDRLATGGELNFNAITNREYYRKKYIFNKVRQSGTINFEWPTDSKFIEKIGEAPVEGSEEWNTIIAHLEKNWLL